MAKRGYGAINKTVSLLLALLLISSSLLVGCGRTSKAPDRTQKAPVVKNPFTFDYELNDSNIAFFTRSDSINSLLASTPFYAGSQPLPSQKTDEFDKARDAKVKEIIDEADILAKTATRVKPKLAAIRSSLLAYLTTSLKEEPRLEEFTKESFGQVSLLMSKEQIVESQYKGIKTDGIAVPYARSFEDYLKVTKAVELGSLYLEDVNNISVYAAMAIKVLENHPSPKVKQANKKLDKDMQALDDIKDELASIVSSIEKIDYGFKQLNTADYYLALEASNFMASSLPDLKAKANTLTPREGLSAQDIAFIQSYLDYFENFQLALSKNLDSVDKGTLIPVDQKKAAGVRIAYAAEGDQNYSKAFSSLSTPLQSTEKKSSGFFAKGWRTIKTTVNGAKTVVGVGLDTIGIAVRNASQIGCGIWYGNTPSEIWEDMRNNSLEIVNNYNKGISGSSTLRTAGEYLENIEKSAGDVAGSAVESGIGKGWASWAVYEVTKTTVGMFTGLGKGIYKVTRTDATTGEVVEGTLDIGLSFIGGSKVVIKASQLPGLSRGLAQEGRLLGQQGINFIESLGANVDKHLIAKEMGTLITKNRLTKGQALSLISNSIELEIREVVSQALWQERERIIKQMMQTVKEGGAAALQESSAGIKQSLNDLIKNSFQNNMRGYLEALRTVTGTSSKDYLDNLVGSWVDDYIKGLIKDVVDGAPDPAEISGLWTGTWVITEIKLPESENSGKSQNPEGCDINIDWDQLKGKSFPLNMNLSVNPDGSGTMGAESIGLDGKESKGNPVPLQYTGGKIVVDRTEQGTRMHMEGQVTRTESGYTINGTLTASIKDKPFIEGTWTATKAK